MQNGSNNIVNGQKKKRPLLNLVSNIASIYVPSPFPNLLSGGYCCVQEAVCESLPKCGNGCHDTSWDAGETNSIPSTLSFAIGILLRPLTCWYRFIPILPLWTLHKVWPTCPCWQMVGSAFHALRPALRSDIHTLSHKKKSMIFGWFLFALNKAAWKIPSAARRPWTLPSGQRNLPFNGNADISDEDGHRIRQGPLATDYLKLVSLNIFMSSGPFIHVPKVLHDLAGNGMHVRSIMAALLAALSATVPEKMCQRFN